MLIRRELPIENPVTAGEALDLAHVHTKQVHSYVNELYGFVYDRDYFVSLQHKQVALKRAHEEAFDREKAQV